MATWLLKSDPDTYAWPHLVREGVTVWDGVRNPVALRNIRSMKRGDRAFVYHTGDERAVVGIAQVESDPFPDPKGNDARLAVVKLKALEPLRRAVGLKELKGVKELSGWELFRQGRLSVVPVSEIQWKTVIDLSMRAAP